MSQSTTNTYHARLAQDLKLAGYRPRTQKSYLERVSNLAAYYNRCPSTLDDDEIRNYFLCCVEKRKHAPQTIRQTKAALRFFYETTLRRPMPMLDHIKAEVRLRLPEIFTEEEVWRVIDSLRLPQHRACIGLLYTCGLRISEALSLTVDDFDKQRQEIRVIGKGNKERRIPIPSWTLNVLRKYWATHRNPKYIFPAIGATAELANIATEPMGAGAPRNALRAAVEQLQIELKEVRLHMLRHSYATHLLDAGINLHTLQDYLGHADIKSTMIYLHMTTQGKAQGRQILETLMRRGAR